jgi:RNA ligase
MSEPAPYPRVPYLFPQPERRGDDLVVGPEERERFLHEPVVVEEKLDGANVMLWLDGEGLVQTAGRSGADGMDRAGQLGRLRAWAAERSDRLRALLTADRVLYAEWLYLTHTVRYDRLPDLLVGTDLYEHEDGFFTVDERDRRLGQAGITTPPRVFSGALEGEERLLTLFGVSAFGSEPAEGLVLRREREGRLLERAKVLRPGFVRVSDDHWGGAPRRNALDERGAGITR